MLLMLLYYLALFFEWHCHMSWVTIKISLPVMYIMAKMEYALTLTLVECWTPVRIERQKSCYSITTVVEIYVSTNYIIGRNVIYNSVFLYEHPWSVLKTDQSG